MYILALDTTAKTAAVGLVKMEQDKLYPAVTVQLNSTTTHSESLLPMIDFCMKNEHITLDEVSIIAVSAGPGSFTGVRIGISTVKGLAFGRDISCVGVSTILALAMNVDNEKKGTVICPVMDARRNQFYNAIFVSEGEGNLKRKCADRAIGFDELFEELSKKYKNKNIVIVGDGAKLFMSLLEKKECDMKVVCAREDLAFQNAYSVARAAVISMEREADYSAEKLLPVYLRLSQAERERNERM